MKRAWAAVERFLLAIVGNRNWDGHETGAMKKQNKKRSKKKTERRLWSGEDWSVVAGRLVKTPGRPLKTSHLFRFVGEKLPYACLNEVATHVQAESDDFEGVYLAHDSMGVARYGGRGDIFSRLASHKKKCPKELLYYSFFIIKNKNNEREIETAILRAAGSQMILNQRKVRTGLAVGNVSDYEPGTYFVERQGQRGRKKKRHGTDAKETSNSLTINAIENIGAAMMDLRSTGESDTFLPTRLAGTVAFFGDGQSRLAIFWQTLLELTRPTCFVVSWID